MAKTYTLNATSVNGGGAGSWTSGYWGGYYGRSQKYIGNEGASTPRAVNILFDATTLATLRTKTITSIKLTITLSSIPNKDNQRYVIGYKLNNKTTSGSSSDCWMRSDKDSTEASTTIICYIRTTTSSASSGSITFDMGTTVPKYGYVCGPNSTYNGYITLSGTPKLVITTNEVDFAISVNDGGTWKSATEVWVNDGGTWKKATGVYVNKNGTWVQSQ